jgi:amidase
MVLAEDVTYLELTEVAELLRTRQVTSVEVTQAVLDKIEAHDAVLQSYVTLTPDVALEAARQADAEIARGGYRGPLHGVPIGVKDLCYTTFAPTGSGSTINAEFKAPYEATVVTRLRAAGAVVTGKLRMTEGAFTTHHPDLPVPVNPWDASTWSGVSSSGSGVATASGLCFGALGSDTGGSIRLPSSMNGVTGLKPTWGRVSRHGIVELAASLDHVGPITRSARDCAAMLGVIAGADQNDPTASLEPVPDYLGGLAMTRTPRVGLDRLLLSTFDEPTQRMINTVVTTLEDLGWTVTEVVIPDIEAIAADFAPLCAVETAAAHEATYPSRASEYGPDLAGIIDVGLAMSAVDLQRLLQRRRAFTGRLRRLFEDVDLLLMPGVGFASPNLETLSTLGSNADLLAALLVPTAPFNIAGVPTVTLPGGFTERGTPLGFQFVGPDFSEGRLLQAAHAYQSVTDFHTRHPQLATTA